MVSKRRTYIVIDQSGNQTIHTRGGIIRVEPQQAAATQNAEADDSEDSSLSLSERLNKAVSRGDIGHYGHGAYTYQLKSDNIDFVHDDFEVIYDGYGIGDMAKLHAKLDPEFMKEFVKTPEDEEKYAIGRIRDILASGKSVAITYIYSSWW